MDCSRPFYGEACPHYDGEERRRRELSRRWVVKGCGRHRRRTTVFVALHYVGTTRLQESDACRRTAAYRVPATGEERLEDARARLTVNSRAVHPRRRSEARFGTESCEDRASSVAQRRQREVDDPPVVARRRRSTEPATSQSLYEPVTALWVSEGWWTRSETVVTLPSAPRDLSRQHSAGGRIPAGARGRHRFAGGGSAWSSARTSRRRLYGRHSPILPQGAQDSTAPMSDARSASSV